MKHTYIISFIAALLGFFCGIPAAASDAENEEIDVKEVVLGHMSDAHEWHITTWNDVHVTIPLPVIVRSETSGWHVFSSARFHDEVISFWNPKTHYQGWFDTMHGGILATMADETAAWTMFRKLQTTGMTSKLEMRYKKPVMTTEGQITVRGRIAEQRRNLVTIDVRIENSHGEVCVEARAVYFAFDKKKAEEMGFTSCELEGDELLPM